MTAVRTAAIGRRLGRTGHIDPELPFKIRSVNERKPAESGLSAEGEDCSDSVKNP
jgi:hypothetical protein